MQKNAQKTDFDIPWAFSGRLRLGGRPGRFLEQRIIADHLQLLIISIRSNIQFKFIIKMSPLKDSQHLKIPLKEIELGTNNFQTCIGKGGFGMVYKGQLSISGKLTTVAVKRLREQFGQGLKEFLTEIQMLTGQTHPNLISLIGYCDEGPEKIIVYEYAERGSLDRYLRSNTTRNSLTWLDLLKICIGAARGLDHLHNHLGPHQAVIHRDVKSSNILIDENWVAKISDLGLSKLSLAGLNRSTVVSHACGTLGYCEPEYVITGTVKKESDIYSFGMVLFEVLCGRLCNIREDDGFSLSSKSVKDHYEKNKLYDIINPNLKEQMSPGSMKVFSKIAYQCLHDDRHNRPSMDIVLKELEKALIIQLSNASEASYASEESYKNTPSLLSEERSRGILSKTQGMLEGMMNPSSVRWKPFIKGDSSRTGGAVGVNGNYNGNDFKKDGLLWSLDIGKCYGGEYSMAVVQANLVLEDQSQIESGSFGTFVGVYDGHGGPEAARYVCDNLFRNLRAISANNYGVVTPETIDSAFLETENGFTSLVSELFNAQPNIATVGSCCLVGVIYHQTLFIANLGDSRVVLGKKVGSTGGISAVQLSSEHNASLEEVREELRCLHPHDPDIVILKHNVWRIKGIIQVSRSIGDAYMKHAEYNTDQIAPQFRLPEPMVMPILSATPTILTHDIQPSDSFLIFASDGLWEHLSNEEAVEIVHNNPRTGIAKRLVKAAFEKAAKKIELRYSDLRKIGKGVRRHFHDDITVIVLILSHDLINVSVRCALDH